MDIMTENGERRPEFFFSTHTSSLEIGAEGVYVDTKDMDDGTFLLTLAVAYLEEIRFFLTREHLDNFPNESVFGAITDAIEEH